MPVSSQIAVWYSKIAWSTPWLISGWYGRVRGEELAALEDGVDDGRHVVVVDAGAEERELAGRVDVPRRELGQVRRELLLGQRRLELERAAEAHAGGDVAEELVDRGDADRPQHLLAGRRR